MFSPHHTSLKQGRSTLFHFLRGRRRLFSTIWTARTRRRRRSGIGCCRPNSNDCPREGPYRSAPPQSERGLCRPMSMSLRGPIVVLNPPPPNGVPHMFSMVRNWNEKPKPSLKALPRLAAELWQKERRLHELRPCGVHTWSRALRRSKWEFVALTRGPMLMILFILSGVGTFTLR